MQDCLKIDYLLFHRNVWCSRSRWPSMGMPYFQTKPCMMFTWLVGGLEHEFHVSIQLGILTPADELIFFRGVAQPPTRWCKNLVSSYSKVSKLQPTWGFPQNELTMNSPHFEGPVGPWWLFSPAGSHWHEKCHLLWVVEGWGISCYGSWFFTSCPVVPFSY